jgi:hypothetical protein
VAEALLLLFDKVCAIVLPHDDAQLLPPLIPVPCATLQVYVVPLAVLDNAILGALPLQMVVEDGVAVIDGVGFTVTEAVAEAVHVLADPVIV